MERENLFYYMNLIFLFYGLESNIKRKSTKIFMSIITISFLLYNFILSNLVYFHNVSDLFTISWLIQVYIFVFSYFIYRYKHRELFKLMNQLSNRIEDKDVKYLSLFLLTVWVICITAFFVFYMFWVKEDAKNDLILNGKESIVRYWLTVIMYTIGESSDALFVFGGAIFEILVYMQTNYIFYCIQRKHYNTLESNKFICIESQSRLGSLRYYEIDLQSIEGTINESIGFIPTIWLTEMFITTCIIITYIATTPQNVWMSLYYSTDLIVSYFVVFIIIVIVGLLSSSYDINKITRIVERIFMPVFQDSKDYSFKLEMIQYLQEVSNRCNNKPKSCGLFRVNSKLILVYLNAVTTFSVMCVQLKSVSK